MTTFFDYDEDIDVNEFFVHLQTVYSTLFKDASTKRYTICVPRQGSFDIKCLTAEVVSTHILKTRLDHSDIRASIITLSGKEVKLNNGHLETISGFEFNKKIKVLFEVDYVNEADDSYKVLCIDRPLEGDNWSQVINGELFNQRLTTREQCMDFLWVSRKSRVKRKVDLLVAPVINLITSSSTLEEVSIHCQNLYNQALYLMLNTDPHFKRHCKMNIYFYEAVQISLETYLMGLLHDSVFTKLYNLQKHDEVEFNKLYLFFSEKVTHKTLQLHSKHCINLDRAGMELDQITRYPCPLEMGLCLDRVISLLSYSPPNPNSYSNSNNAINVHSSTNSFSSSRKPSAAHRSSSSRKHSSKLQSNSSVEMRIREDTVVFSADELLPLLVLLIVKSRIPCWLTIINYLTNYRVSEKVSSRVSYAITTFEAAILFIRRGYLKSEYERELCSIDADPSSLINKHRPGSLTPTLKRPISKDQTDNESSLVATLTSTNYNCDSGVLVESNIDSETESQSENKTCNSDDVFTSESNPNPIHRLNWANSRAVEKKDNFSLFLDNSLVNGKDLNIDEDEDSKDAKTPISSTTTAADSFFDEFESIHKLFQFIKEDRRDEMLELLEDKKDQLIETLCHPLCNCPKCLNIKEGGTASIGNRGNSVSSSSSFSSCSYDTESVSGKSNTDGKNNHASMKYSRDERGWTALHAAAFYGNQFALEKLINLEYNVSTKNNQGLTPLHLACIEAHQNICMLLLYYNCPVNAPDKDGNTGLHIACMKGHFHVVTALIYQQGIEPININAQNVLQETPLFMAAKFGYVDIVSELVDNGADISLENTYGEGPLQVCLDEEVRSILFNSCQFDTMSLNNALLTTKNYKYSLDDSTYSPSSYNDESLPTSNSSFVFESSKRSPSSSVMSAVQFPILKSSKTKGKSHSIVKLDNEKSLEVNRGSITSKHFSSKGSHRATTSELAYRLSENRNNEANLRYQMTRSHSHSCLNDTQDNPSWFYSHESKNAFERKLKLLLERVRANDVEKVLFLLGAASRSDKNEPIVFAHSLCHPKCNCNNCALLKKNAAEPPSEYTLTVNSQSDESVGGLSPLHAAVISGLVEMCVVLLNQGASVFQHSPPSMNTPLHFACQYNRPEIASLLLEYGADGNARNREQNTPLHLAAYHGHEWPVTLLSSVSNVNLNLVNAKGDTPLHISTSQGHVKTTKCLLDSGADPNIKNEASFTPLEIALLNNFSKIASLLAPMSTPSRSLSQLETLNSKKCSQRESTERIVHVASSQVGITGNCNDVSSESTEKEIGTVGQNCEVEQNCDEDAGPSNDGVCESEVVSSAGDASSPKEYISSSPLLTDCKD